MSSSVAGDTESRRSSWTNEPKYKSKEVHQSTRITQRSNFQFAIMPSNFSIQLYNFTSIFTASTSLTVHYSFKQRIPAASGDSRQ